MNDLGAIYVIVLRELKKFVREKSRLVSSIARPLIWLFMVGGGLSRLVTARSGIAYTQFIFPGILGMTILFSAMFSSISIIWDKEFGFLKEILVAPVRRSSIIIGKALSGTAVSSIQAAIILLVAPAIGLHIGPARFALTLAICMMVSFSISSFGLLLASFYESYESFSVIMNFIIMPMFFLSGAMYPVRMLPPALKAASVLNPLTYGVDALKNSVFALQAGPMGPDFPLGTDIAVIISCSAVLVFAATAASGRKG
ncbi:MAG: ABC transporter permease [Actinomycetota bacterium]|nr:ABC transporter permease [Actinomycetota bacterium]